MLARIPLLVTIAFSSLNVDAAEPVSPPPGVPDYVAQPRPSAGQHLALTVEKLSGKFSPDRPFLIWAIGSSYTNMLGNGDTLIEQIRERFPDAPEIIYKKMVGNSVPYQYIRGWARHLVVPEQPDLVLGYTNGKPEDLEKLILEIRRHSTADIIIPTLHWRQREKNVWPDPEAATDMNPSALRAICKRYGVEFVENRRQWGQYLSDNNLPVEALLKDAVHQSHYGAKIINRNIAAHIQTPTHGFAYNPRHRERRLVVGQSNQIQTTGNTITVTFTGNRIDLIADASPTGGSATVTIDGIPGDEVPVFAASYIQPHKNNARAGRSPPRDCSPHGIEIGPTAVPETWTIAMTSDSGDFELNGSQTGPDGTGNSADRFVSNSGQITIDPDLWRRREYNHTGDTFTFDVRRTSLGTISVQSEESRRVRIQLALGLENGPHELKLVPEADGEFGAVAFDVFEPPRVGVR